MHQVQGAGFVRYWPKTTKYQIAPSFTDLLTPSTDQYRPLLTQYYMYEPVPPSTTPVHSIFFGHVLSNHFFTHGWANWIWFPYFVWISRQSFSVFAFSYICFLGVLVTPVSSHTLLSSLKFSWKLQTSEMNNFEQFLQVKVSWFIINFKYIFVELNLINISKFNFQGS